MEMCLSKYSDMPKKGKPKSGEEWTPLSAVVCHDGEISRTVLFIMSITIIAACFLMVTS